MLSLKKSKTLWGFGLALVIYVAQKLLVGYHIVSQDDILLTTSVEVIIAVASFFGIYGIRDSIRKLKQLDF